MGRQNLRGAVQGLCVAAGEEYNYRERLPDDEWRLVSMTR